MREGGGEVAGSQLMNTAVHRSPNELWRSNFIFNLCLCTTAADIAHLISQLEYTLESKIKYTHDSSDFSFYLRFVFLQNAIHEQTYKPEFSSLIDCFV